MSNIKRIFYLVTFLFIHASADKAEWESFSDIEIDLFQIILIRDTESMFLANISSTIAADFFSTLSSETSLSKDIENCLQTAIENIVSNPTVGIFENISLWPKIKIDSRDVCFSPYMYKEHPYICETLAFIELLYKSETFTNIMNEYYKQPLNYTIIDYLTRFIYLCMKNHQKETFPLVFMCFFKTVFYRIYHKIKTIYESSNPDEYESVAQITVALLEKTFTLPMQYSSFSMIYSSQNCLKKWPFRYL